MWSNPDFTVSVNHLRSKAKAHNSCAHTERSEDLSVQNTCWLLLSGLASNNESEERSMSCRQAKHSTPHPPCVRSAIQRQRSVCPLMQEPVRKKKRFCFNCVRASQISDMSEVPSICLMAGREQIMGPRSLYTLHGSQHRLLE